MNKSLLLLIVVLTAAATIVSKKIYDHTITGSYKQMLRSSRAGHRTVPQDDLYYKAANNGN